MYEHALWGSNYELEFNKMDAIDICPNFTAELVLWPIEESPKLYDLLDYASNFVGSDEERYLPLFESSGLTIEQFYTLFTSNNSDEPCVEIKLGIFPKIGWGLD